MFCFLFCWFLIATRVSWWPFFLTSGEPLKKITCLEMKRHLSVLPNVSLLWKLLHFLLHLFNLLQLSSILIWQHVSYNLTFINLKMFSLLNISTVLSIMPLKKSIVISIFVPTVQRKFGKVVTDCQFFSGLWSCGWFIVLLFLLEYVDLTCWWEMVHSLVLFNFIQ